MRRSEPPSLTAVLSPAVLHTQGPVDGSLYAKVRKKSTPDPGVPGGPPAGPSASIPDPGDHTLSVSSDSGRSTASARTDRTEEPPVPAPRRGLSPQEKAELDQLLSGFGLEDSGNPREDMMDGRSKCGGTRHVVPAQVHVNGAPKDRETDILDDEVPGHGLRSVDGLGALSPDRHPAAGPGAFACHRSSPHARPPGGFGSGTGVDLHGPLGPGPEPLCERQLAFGGRGPKPPPPALGSPCVPPTALAFEPGGYSTQTWVRQQQMAAACQYSFGPDGEAGLVSRGPTDSPQRAQALPRVPVSSWGATQRGAGPEPQPPDTQRPPPSKASRARFPDVRAVNGTGPGPSADPAPGSPTADIDQSIEQLNRLILELDPTFQPLPTHADTPGPQASGPARQGEPTFRGACSAASGSGAVERTASGSGGGREDRRRLAQPHWDRVTAQSTV